MRPLEASLLITGVIISFGVGAWSESQRLSQPAPISEMQSRESTAIYMLRLGLLDWNAACAYEAGRSNMPRDAMFRACPIRLNIGEPLHPERREPSK